MVDFFIASAATAVVVWTVIKKFKSKKRDEPAYHCGCGCSFCSKRCAQNCGAVDKK